MDIRQALDRKQQQIAEAEARVETLRKEWETLNSAWEIMRRESAPPEAFVTPRPRGGMGGSALVSAASETAPTTTTPGRTLVQAIREVVSNLQEPFTTKDVRDRLRELDPAWYETLHQSSVSGTMRRMSETDLVVVEKGGPGREATYRRRLPGEIVAEPRSEEEGADDMSTVIDAV